jgi:hypothetical protein
VLRLTCYWLMPLAAEDAYISFHAVLDPSWHKATTSPLWCLILTPGHEPEILARFWSLAADIGALVSGYKLLPRYGFYVFAAYWSMPFFVGSAVSGLETHLAAAAMLLARLWPGGYTIAAALRPDTTLLSLAASGRKWRWALTGAVLYAVIGICYWNGLPNTIGSKLEVYGIHPGAWGWLVPNGFGWLTAFLIPASLRGFGLLLPISATLMLIAHALLGSPQFWWYAVAPLAMLGFSASAVITTRRRCVISVLILGVFAWPQFRTLGTRLVQEANVWETGAKLAEKSPTGTIMLEPAGMIPYENRQLKVVDDVGLVEPWMADRRARGPGWRTDAIAKFKPNWIIVRMREYVLPNTWAIGRYAPYYGHPSNPESLMPDYGVVMAPGVTIIGKPDSSGARVGQAKLVSSNLLVLRRKHLTP